jgi:hypothetical protein
LIILPSSPTQLKKKFVEESLELINERTEEDMEQEI